jgi:hypothetical protein
MKIQRGSIDIALLFLLPRARCGEQRHIPALLPRERARVPVVQEGGWAPVPVWTFAENLVPTGI